MPREGAKSGKGSRSSKTARVLSLLTDPESAAEEKPQKAAAEEKPQKAAAPAADHAQLDNDAHTEAQIRDALESELASLAPAPARPQSEPVRYMPEPLEPAPAEEAAPQPADTAESAVPAAPSAPQAAPAETVPAAPEVPAPPPPVVEAPVVEAPAAPAPQPAPAAAEPATGFSTPIVTQKPSEAEQGEGYTVLNVTQALVEEKADKYIRMFGMCSCERCRIDVIALALSGLPAKYVVVKGKDINPRLSFYESKYSAAVITSVMSACKKVLDKPHHER